MVSSIAELHQEYGERLVVIGVDAQESPDVVRSFVEAHDLQYLNLIANGETLRAYGLRGHPVTVFVERHGRIYRSYLGYTEKEVLEADGRALIGRQ